MNFFSNRYADKTVRQFVILMICGGLSVSPLTAATINEIRIDQGGDDIDEYFEIAGTPGESLDGLFYIVLGDDSDSDMPSGAVEAIIDLNGLAIPDDGYFLVAEDNDTFGAVADLFSEGLVNFENSDNVTHALVRGLDPSVNTGNGFGNGGTHLDTNDDGTLDVQPFAEIVDWVSFVETTDGTGELVYADTKIGPDGNFVPAHIYRNPNGTGDWTIGSFSPDFDTPGVANVPEPSCIALLFGVAIYGFLARCRHGN